MGALQSARIGDPARQGWRRYLGTFLALPVLIVLGAEPTREADRRLAAAVWIGRLLIFLAAIGGFWWLVTPVLALQQRVGVWLALAVFGPIGTLLELIALAGMLQTVALHWRGRRAMATVVSATNPSEDTRFQFSDPDGQTHIVSRPVMSVDREFGAGQQVPLIYLPGHPETFVVDKFGDKWGVPLLFFALGLLILLLWSVYAFGLQQYITTRASVFVPLIFCTVGGIFAAIGFTFFVKILRFRREALRTTGVIVASQSVRELRAERSRKEGNQVLTEAPTPSSSECQRWTITVEFAEATGTARRANLDVSKAAGDQVYRVGDPQSVLYHPDRPWEIQIDASSTWIGPLLLGLLGAFFVVAGMISWIVGMS
jgi:hypothetical protein